MTATDLAKIVLGMERPRGRIVVTFTEDGGVTATFGAAVLEVDAGGWQWACERAVQQDNDKWLTALPF